MEQSKDVQGRQVGWVLRWGNIMRERQRGKEGERQREGEIGTMQLVDKVIENSEIQLRKLVERKKKATNRITKENSAYR